MKKLSLLFVIWLLFCAAGASADEGRAITLGELLPPLVATERPIFNADHLFEGLNFRPEMKDFFKNDAAARWALVDELKSLKRQNISLPCSISTAPESIFNFSLAQTLRVYLILDALKKGDLVRQIGKIIRAYPKDSRVEPGGLGILKKGRLELKPAPSAPFIIESSVTAGYLIPDEAFAQPHLFLFHLHPPGTPGPSWSTEYSDGKEANIKYDIGTALKRASRDGDYHHLLICLLDNGRFEVFYYSTEKITKSPHLDSFQFCDQLAGFRILDLGIWEY